MECETSDEDKGESDKAEGDKRICSIELSLGVVSRRLKKLRPFAFFSNEGITYP
jgi:hypothetical protein